MEKRFVYADNSATTAVSKPVLDSMLPYLTENYGNPSSVYSKGREAKTGLDAAREKVAKALNAKVNEIFFTSCGTESDNWAIKGAATVGAKKGKKHLITTNYEHHAVLHSFQTLEKQGFEVIPVPVDYSITEDASPPGGASRLQTKFIAIIPQSGNLALTTNALKEYLGYFVYKLQGWL